MKTSGLFLALFCGALACTVRAVSPAVSIISPTPSASTSVSSIAFTAAAFDSDGAVQSVEFFAGAVSLGQATKLSNSSNWRLIASFASVGPGSYTITAVATDDASDVTTSAALDLTVSAALSAAPSVAVSASAASIGVSQEVTLFAQASDEDGTIGSVSFYANGVNIGTKLTAPYNLSWTPSVAGVYRVEAIATDNTNNTSISNTVTITVGANTEPTAQLVVPITTITRGSSLPINIDAGDFDGAVVSVAFFANGGLVATDDLTDGILVPTISWTPTVTGTYRLVGRVQDDAGNIVFTPEVLVTVKAEVGERPSGSLNLRAANTEFPPCYTQGSSVVVCATANDSDGKITSVRFTVNGQTLATRTAEPYTTTYTFASTDVNRAPAFAAIIQDEDGNTQVASATAAVYSLNREVPRISFTSPTADATLTQGSTIEVSAAVAPIDATLHSVQLLQNGRLITSLSKAPYVATLSLDTPGTIELRAVTYYENRYFRLVPNAKGDGFERVEFDIAAAGISGARTLTVVPATGAAPTVSIATPTNGATVTTASTLNLTATAFDSDGSVSSVEFFVNGVSAGQASQTTGSASWRLPFSFGTRGAGSYTLTALATDSSGNRVLSAPVTITVVGATTLPPTVSVSASAPKVYAGQPVTFTASVVDSDDTVASVQFFANGINLGTITTSPFTTAWTPTSAGTYAIVAIAADSSGNTAISSPLNITVAANQYPVVAITSPVTGGFLSTGQEIKIFANATDGDGTVAKVEFFANGASIGSAVSAPYTVKWTPGIAGDYALTASATDNLGAVSSSAEAVNLFAAFQVRLSPLVDSNEFINAVYSDLLDRTPTTAELDDAVLRFGLRDEPVTRAQFIVELEGKPEYQVRLQQIIAYKILIGVWPTREELQTAIDSVSGNNSGESDDDHGDNLLSATTVTSASTAGRIETWGDIDFFRINVTQEGTFTFSTSGSTDTVGVLYDSNGNVLADDDQGGVGNNFSIGRTLTPGTYYISVEGWLGWFTGSYQLKVNGPGIGPGGALPGSDVKLGDFINALFNSRTYQAKYGALLDLGTASNRVAVFTQFYVNAYGAQPTAQQQLEGSSNLNAIGSAATYVSYMVTRTKINGRDLIYGAPDFSAQHLSAALILGLQRIRPVMADVQPLAAMSALDRAQAVIDDVDYVNRYITVDNPPLSQTIPVGGTFRLSVGARGAQPFTYQWYRNGSPLFGAVSQFLTINNVTEVDAGLYSVEITGPTSSVFSLPAVLTVGTNSTKLINLSTRGRVGDGEAVMIAGFVVSGTEPRQFLIRGAGPALAKHGISTFVVDPMLTLYRGDTVIAQNNDWMDGGQEEAIAAVGARVGAGTFEEASKDAALVVTLEPGIYTVHMSGRNGGTGIGLVDVFDAGTSQATRAINVSTRAAVGAGGHELVIAGFVVSGTSPRRMLVRAVGPGLAKHGVSGVLANPRLTLHREDGNRINENDDWSSGTDAAAITALSEAFAGSGLDSGGKDSAILVTLAPGIYTAHVTGENGGVGVVLVEVFDVER